MIHAAILLVAAIVIIAKIIAAITLLGLLIRSPFDLWEATKCKLYGGTWWEKWIGGALLAYVTAGGLYALFS